MTNKQTSQPKWEDTAEHGGGREESLSVRGIQLSIFANTFHVWILHSKFQTQCCKLGWILSSISPSQVACQDAPDSHLTERLPTLPQEPFLGALYFHHSQERFVCPALMHLSRKFLLLGQLCHQNIQLSIHYSSRSLICESGGKIIPVIVSACIWRLFTDSLCCYINSSLAIFFARLWFSFSTVSSNWTKQWKAKSSTAKLDFLNVLHSPLDTTWLEKICIFYINIWFGIPRSSSEEEVTLNWLFLKDLAKPYTWLNKQHC